MDVLIFRGLPGAGKSTIANDVCNGNVIEADEYFYEEVEPHKPNKYSFTPEKLDKAHNQCYRKFIMMLKKLVQGNIEPPIGVANTNVERGEYTPYIKAANNIQNIMMILSEGELNMQRWELDIKLVKIFAQVDTCVERQKTRERENNPPPEAIEDMSERWESRKPHDPPELVLNNDQTGEEPEVMTR